MPHIQVLDQITIDKIAAGEVIERPASVVKELVENSIDAGATNIVTEIQEGGISLIRITDNGAGIPREDVPGAFLRHSTSKIRSVDDLTTIASLGFRGEALSSIAAVTKTELITKTREEIFGTRYSIEGGQEIELEDTGAPDGATFLVRQLFYNVPARRKFLKTASTEAGHIQELLMHLALSHPEVAFTFVSNGQEKLRTSGNGKLKDVIYSIYGRQAAMGLIDIDYSSGGLHITGFLGKPELTRANRNFENFFVNGRYVKSAVLSKAVEDGYSDFLMQHRFPFVALHFKLDGSEVDVNVHPAKTELRFQNQQQVYNTVFEAVRRTLLEPELIPQVEAPPAVEIKGNKVKEESPFLLKPRAGSGIVTRNPEPETEDEEYFLRKMRERVLREHQKPEEPKPKLAEEQQKPDISRDILKENGAYEAKKPNQLDLFEDNFLKRDVKAEYRLIGQVFDTYWIVEFKDSVYIIDQHAAHERVLYEHTMREMKTREFTSQNLSPPIILSLSMSEAEILEAYMQRFEDMGFEIEPFGGEEYAVRAVPDNLFRIAKKELLMEMIDSLSDGISPATPPELITEKLASMSCKAAVKGNSRLSAKEADALIGELLTLDNPYHCPHGRPTIISMTKHELEKKFKRIV